MNKFLTLNVKALDGLIVSRDMVAVWVVLSSESVTIRPLHMLGIINLECSHVVVSGPGAEAFHDELDEFIYENLDKSIVTTWYDDESMKDVAWNFLNNSFSNLETKIYFIVIDAEGDQFFRLMSSAAEALMASNSQ